MPPSLTPNEFVTKWRHSELKERSSYQEHFIDLCRLIGHQTPAELDPKGDFFTFEAGASKLTGGQGWADVWYKGRFAWEYKGKDADLDKAYQQLQQYRESLMNPPLLIVSDIDQIQIHTNFTNTVHKVYTLTLDDLLDPSNLALLRAAFNRPEELRAPLTTEQVTQEAAAQFARLSAILLLYGEDPSRIAHFLIRLLFCLFAEDIGLLPSKVFTNLVQRARNRPDAFNAQLRQLFAAMSTGGWFGSEEIRHFDGHLFDDDTVLDLDSDGIDILSVVCTLDWSSIEPSIFGTLFERSLDPSKRAQLGAHYTSKEDILLIVEPVLMAPYRRKWSDIQVQAQELVEKIEKAKAGQRTRLHGQLVSLLMGFAGELAQVQVLDPACGSGNFLYVALRQLLDLEKEVINLAGSLNVGRFFPSISPAQLHGIEINEYAHQLAQATIWIGYIQWMNENGFGYPPEPILKPLDNIILMDAILILDKQGNPIEPQWPKSDVIIGNPPFLGDKKMRAELGDTYVEQLHSVYKNRIPGQSDLVCYWFEKARSEIESRIANRVGLLATQGIRGGANRIVLDKIKNSGDIFWAQSDREWILDGAMVHVSMVGFDNGDEVERFLDKKMVNVINSDLTTDIDLTIAENLPENSGISFQGVTKYGPFEIDNSIARELLSAPVNITNRPNSDVVKPYYNAQDIMQNWQGYYIIDFNNLTESEASIYELPYEYILRLVKPYRDSSRVAGMSPWWQHWRRRPELQGAIDELNRFIVTPRVSKHRVFVWLPRGVIANDALIAFARGDDYFLGVLQSKQHELWARRKGTQLREAESGFRYTPTTTFETFPLPWPPGTEPIDDPRVQAIAEAARELDNKRNAWLNPPGASESELKKRTLTNLYNQRPTWLDLAHRKLDEAVFAAYGWSNNISDEEILEKLLVLNLKRSSV